VQTLLGHIERWLAYSQAPLEDCAGEKEIMSKINLNTTPHWGNYGKKRKNHRIFHYRGEIKIAGKETDTQECKECHEILPLIAFTTHLQRSDGAYILRKICRECSTVYKREQSKVKKNAPPKPECCDCCHKKTKKLQRDHIHGTFIFRGWVCPDCNAGIGKLRDNLEGVLRGALYLEKDKNKIIEKLNEME